MNVLALDASSKYFSVAVEINGKIEGEFLSSISDSHNEGLSSAVNAVLAEAGIGATDLTLIVIGEGPGSFTGLRIGYGFTKGISFSLGVPLYSYSSFAAIAVLQNRCGRPVLVCSDARRDELFFVLFEDDFKIKPKIAGIKEVEALIDIRNPIVMRPDKEPLPIARGLCALRSILGKSLATEPDYLRAVSARTIAERRQLTS